MQRLVCLGGLWKLGLSSKSPATSPRAMSRTAGLRSPLAVPLDPPVGLPFPLQLLSHPPAPPQHCHPPTTKNSKQEAGSRPCVCVYLRTGSVLSEAAPVPDPGPAPGALQRTYTEQGCVADRPSRGQGWRRLEIPILTAACTPTQCAGYISPLLLEGLLRSQVTPLACFSSSVDIPTFSLARPGVRGTTTPLLSPLLAPTSPQAAGSRESVPGPPFPCALSEWGLRGEPACNEGPQAEE